MEILTEKSFPLCVRIAYIDGLQPKKVLFYLKSWKHKPIRFVYAESHGLPLRLTPFCPFT